MDEQEKIYNIRLADGTLISGLRLNGNNFVSMVPIEESLFEGRLSKVVISDGETETEYGPMKLIQIAKYGQEYYFILAEMTREEIEKAKLRADIDYIAMMTDTEF